MPFAWGLSAFLVGSIPVGLLIGRWWAGVDIRRYGTGNVGASNVFRNVGLVPAAVVGVASFLQGLLPPLAAALLARSPLAVAVAAVGAVAGYAWSPWLRFQGGSAVGTATGASAVLSPLGLVPLLALYAAGGLLRQPAPGVLLGIAAYLGWLLLAPSPAPFRTAGVLVAAIVVAKRFDGGWADLGRPDRIRVLTGRLVFDRKPGRPLAGRVK